MSTESGERARERAILIQHEVPRLRRAAEAAELLAEEAGQISDVALSEALHTGKLAKDIDEARARAAKRGDVGRTLELAVAALVRVHVARALEHVKCRASDIAVASHTLAGEGRALERQALEAGLEMPPPPPATDAPSVARGTRRPDGRPALVAIPGGGR